MKVSLNLDKKNGVRWPSILDEPVLRENNSDSEREHRLDSLKNAYETRLNSIGKDPMRQGHFIILTGIY